MELMRLGDAGEERPCVRVGEEVFDLTSVTEDIDGAFLASGGIDKTRALLKEGGLSTVSDWRSRRVGAPIARPQAVVCIGMNYAAHAAESGSAPPSSPVIFFKHPNTVVGPNDDLVMPPTAEKLDWEVELAVVIGRRASYLSSPEAAAEHIAGFTIAHDVSERAFQIEQSGGQWSKGKCCPTFSPLGPVLVPFGEENHADLRLRTLVNGEVRQDSSTADMVFGVEYLVWYLSHYMALEPGDVISTGTPQGVALSGRFPYLSVGDTITLSVDGLGQQRQTVVPAVLA